MIEQFEHKKSLGQHFLNSHYIPKKMCAVAGEIKGKTVLEIGPGTGILTREILAHGAKVVAIETDPRAISSLEDSFPQAISAGQLVVCRHDARQLNPAQFGLENQGYIVISNIPYYLSGHLFRQLIDTDCQPTTIVFLIQKELAERIARTKKESLISLSVKAFGEPTYICTVKRTHFTPPPKVDSAIVAVKNINRLNFKSVSSANFFRILHLGFAHKRKQLIGNLSDLAPRPSLESIFTELAIPHSVRAEDVSLDQWLKLAIKLLSTA